MSNSNKLFIALLFAGLAFFFYTKSRALTKNELPELSRELINGQSFDMKSLSGNLVLIDFWGSWCPPCRKENPKLVGLYDKYHDANFKSAKNFEIVSIAMERNDRRVEAAIEKDGLKWPYHILEVSKVVLSSGLARSFGVSDLPTKFLYDDTGKLIGVNMTVAQIDEFLGQQLQN